MILTERTVTVISPPVAVILATLGLLNAWAAIPAAVLLTVALCAVAVVTSPRRWASAPAVYMWFFAAFHTALLALMMLGMGPSGAAWQTQDWLIPEALRGAARILLVAEVGLMAGLCLTALMWRPAAVRIHWPAPERRLTIVGDVLLSAGLVSFVVVFLQVRGWTLIGGGYEIWRDAAAGAVVSSSAIMLLVMFGMALLTAGGPSKARARGYVGFAGWAAVSLLLGNRSEVIIPIAAVVVVFARQRRLAFRWFYVPLILLALTGASWVRVARTSSTGPMDAVNPLSGLAEMGATLRTVVESWRWHVGFNEDYVGWRTYWRLFGKILPGQAPVDADPNVFGQTVLSRVGAIGGSPVAEAFHSAGLAGAFIVLMVVGVVLMAMEMWPASAFSNAAVGGLMSILLVWVRNDFTPVVAQLFMLAGLITIAGLLPKRMTRAGPTSRH